MRGSAEAAAMWNRVRALFRAEFAALSGIASLIATAASHALMAGLLGGIVRGEIGTFAFACYAFGVATALLALPLVGEVGTWLRTRSAAEWVASLPARPSEVGLARLIVALLALIVLSLGSLLPLTFLAPGLEGSERLGFLVLGLMATLTFGSLLLSVQSLLAHRAPNLLVLLQTATTLAVAAGLLLGLPAVIGMSEVSTLSDLAAGARLRIPTATFAAPLGPGGANSTNLAWAVGATVGSLAIAWIVASASDTRQSALASTSPLDRLLAPLRRAALAVWVRGPERAGFEFVWSAMPKERETALRTYPLLAVPLLFAWVASGTQPGEQREAFLALLLFTPGFYLPVLLAHVPASSSHTARWLLDTGPFDRTALERGAFKAVAVRYVLPLHAALGLLAWQQAGADTALRLALPATFVTLLVLRPLYRVTAADLPLSIPPEEAGDPNALTAPLMMAGIGLAVVALIANAALATPAAGLVAALVLGALEIRPRSRA
jgi:hypothetical protein